MLLRLSTKRAEAAVEWTARTRSISVSRRTTITRGARIAISGVPIPFDAFSAANRKSTSPENAIVSSGRFRPAVQCLGELLADERHRVGPEIERADLRAGKPVPERVGDHHHRRHRFRDLRARTLAVELDLVDLGDRVRLGPGRKTEQLGR